MALSNTELRYYDSNVLRLPDDKRTEYHEQVDRLIAELCKSVRDKTEIKITKVVKAGSFAKYTILRKTRVDPVDVDVVFYVSGRDADKETLDNLNNTIYDLLIKQYPNKSVEHFEIQRKAAIGRSLQNRRHHTISHTGHAAPDTWQGAPPHPRQRHQTVPVSGHLNTLNRCDPQAQLVAQHLACTRRRAARCWRQMNSGKKEPRPGAGALDPPL